jgi:hypothetical protein
VGAKLKVDPVRVMKLGRGPPFRIWALLIDAEDSTSVMVGRLYVVVFPTTTV